MAEPRLIRRTMRFERNFTQLPNSWVRDEQLSFRARGLLSMLMSHETGWHVTLKALASSTPSEGVDALRTATNELEEQGYLKRVTLKGRGGRFEGTTWEICDPHDLGAEPLFTALDNPTTARTALDYPTRTALDNPTPIRTQVKEDLHTSVNKPAIDARATEQSRCPNGHPLVDDRHCSHGCLVTDLEAVAS